ncbi:MAG TPA: phosphatase PAP2 family protein [Thermoleophilaceae bacterium]|nr:phosphatase PAP2 family protein [Thermoleophilaceae bacterium]
MRPAPRRIIARAHRRRTRPHERALRRITAADRALFARVARMRSGPLDRVLLPVTRAADHSKLWMALAAALAIAGGRREQRAAIRGIGSVGATSLLVNQVVKRAVRRPRPELRNVPAARRLRAQPLTTSFPSGHAASAAAFAAGAGSELPAARTPLGALAAAVGFSRTYVGVHYPLDVLVGAAAGAAVGLASRLQWPLLPAEIEECRPTSEPVRLDPRPDGEGVAIVVNAGAGNGVSGPDLADLRERLPRARIEEVTDPDGLPAALAEAAREAEVLGICGGDGSTVTAVETALECGLPLLLLPAGTLNHLGRDLRVESADDAIDALARGDAVSIDIGEIDGRPFINTASFGAYTRMLEIRGGLEKRIGRWPAHLAAVVLAAFRAEPLRLLLDGERRTAWMVFIGNGRHEPRGFAPSWRPELDDGMLDVRVLGGERPFARTRLLVSVLAGRLTRCAAYEQRCVGSLEVETGREAMSLARDGDGFEGSGDFHVGKLRRALTVYAPVSGAEANGDR